MFPRLLLAPAGHGKTEHLIRRIRQILSEEPFAPVLVVVPNAIQAAGFRQRLVAAGGALGVNVYTFHTLYAELLIQAGQPMPLLTDPVRVRLLRAIVDDLCERDEEGQGEGKIRHYAALRNRPGFITLLRNGIEELKRARIFPADFNAAARDLPPRLGEVSLIYSEYQDWLQRNNWADNEGRGWLAAIALESNPDLGSATRFLAVSGFDEFNPTQLAVLSLLARRAKETTITLTGDIERPQRPAQRRFQRAQAAITSSLGIEPEMMGTETQLIGEIAQVEDSIFDTRTSNIEYRTPNIEFLEAQTRPVEVRAALRWLKARVVRDGMVLNDVAVLARDIEPYRPFLEETAAEFGIPMRIVGGQPLIGNPAVAALLSLLSLPVEDWPRRPVLDAWRSPYFDWSGLRITPESATALDEISRAGKVLQGLSQWDEAFEIWEKKQILADEDGELPESITPTDKSNREKFEAFVDLLTVPGHATVKQFIAFIENLMGEDPALTSAQLETGSTNIVACARAAPETSERDVAALRAFKDVLRGLALAEATLETVSLDYANFYADLRAAVESAAYTIPGQAGMLAASVLDGRGLAFQAAALLGLSEGEFPRLEREDVLFSESDREMLRARGLPLETRLRGDEGSLFYQAVTRSRQKLLLTRPYLADDGQPWEPSPFWEEMRHLSGSRPVVRVRPEDGLTDAAEAASPVEWREAAREFDIHMKKGGEALMARLAPKAAGEFEGGIFDLSERFGQGFGWSASKLESYGTCPFEFFVAYALGLEPRTAPEEGFDVRMLGSMLHQILEDVYGAASDLETCLSLLPEKARAVFERAPQEYGFRPTALWAVQQQELERRLRETITALDEVSQGFRPFRMEARFGMGEPSLVLRTEAGEVRLHGYIDRLDAAPDGSLRVIDYKSGGAAISAAHLKEGRRLQLPIYALAARDALGLGEVSGGFYWHIQSAKASSLKLEKYEGGVDAAFATAVAHVGRNVNGIRSGHFEPKPPAEGCPSYCPAVGFCWRYKKGF
ncbi:MAG: exodeoxyribonuclease V subunit gamma [Anaerolineales bacterium]|nr:exodeoxyribonuclease V subunit gamma [Anaerolineales bacterium]